MTEHDINKFRQYSLLVDSKHCKYNRQVNLDPLYTSKQYLNRNIWSARVSNHQLIAAICSFDKPYLCQTSLVKKSCLLPWCASKYWTWHQLSRRLHVFSYYYKIVLPLMNKEENVKINFLHTISFGKDIWYPLELDSYADFCWVIHELFLTWHKVFIWFGIFLKSIGKLILLTVDNLLLHEKPMPVCETLPWHAGEEMSNRDRCMSVDDVKCESCKSANDCKSRRNWKKKENCKKRFSCLVKELFCRHQKMEILKTKKSCFV